MIAHVGGAFDDVVGQGVVVGVSGAQRIDIERVDPGDLDGRGENNGGGVAFDETYLEPLRLLSGAVANL